MKFSQKVALAIVLPVCLVLSVSGTWSVHRSFVRELEVAAQTHSEAQMQQRYTLEALLAGAEDDSIGTFLSLMQQYEAQEQALGKGRIWFSILGEQGTVLYSTMPFGIPYAKQQEAAAAREHQVLYHTDGTDSYQILCTRMWGAERPLWLVNAYDAGNQFAERDRLIRQDLFRVGGVLLLVGAAALIVARLLTQPLRQLETASRALSRGELTARVQIRSRDELEHLGNTFNTMAEAVENQVQALREESARQKRFVAAFSHELKTPMTAILGYANLLRSGEQAPDKRHRAAGYIYHESQRLEELSRELLLLFGLEQGGVALQDVKLSAVWGDVRRSLPELEPRLRWEGKDAAVRADRPLLTALLRNLILNAAHADGSGGTILFWNKETADGVRVGVTDAGTGIPPEELDKLTEPFYRVDKSRSRMSGGNGLGLTICAQIAQAHGARLQIESAAGQGTTVWITLKEVTP